MGKSPKLRPLLVSFSDGGGGAMEAAKNSHEALLNHGLASTLLVSLRRRNTRRLVETPSEWKAIRDKQAWWNYLPARLFRAGQKRLFSPATGPSWVPQAVETLPHDLIHLHWVQEGMLPVKDFSRLPGPLVLTLHDSWAMTGGCHLPQDCTRWKQGCGNCPCLGLSFPWDLSRMGFKQKEKHWRNIDLTLVAPSKHLAEKTRQSPLLSRFPVEVIPNPIDTKRFKAAPKAKARKKWGLPPKAKIVLSGAVNFEHDPNKGLDLLRAALLQIPEKSRPELALVGLTSPVETLNLPVKVHDLGHLSRKDMALAYSAADAFVLPSRSENLPTMLLEAMACSRPVAAFAIDGCREVVKNGREGWLAGPGDSAGLAKAILKAIKTPGTNAGARGRETVMKKYEAKKVAAQTEAFYRRVVGHNASSRRSD